MGEAMAKPSLTLLNLCVEELGFLMFCKQENILWCDDPAPFLKWRYCHIGGDDHLLRGPRPYLKMVTDLHIASGSIISAEKHGFSQYCVKYCERLLNLRNLKYNTVHNKNHCEKSLMVDAVKVRLLERGQSTLAKKDNKNIAIGKSRALGEYLEWLSTDGSLYSETKLDSIRDLFIARMGGYLPSKFIHPKLYHIVYLPAKLGGFNLGNREKWFYHLKQAPVPYRWLLKKYRAGQPVSAELSLLSQLNTNVSKRGIKSIGALQDALLTQLREFPDMVNALTEAQLKARYPGGPFSLQEAAAFAAEEGIFSFEDFAEMVTRGTLFQELLLNREPLSIYNTRPITQTFKRIWDGFTALGTDKFDSPWDNELDEMELYSLIAESSQRYFLDIRGPTSVDIGHWDPLDPDSETYDFIDVTMADTYTLKMPSLVTGLQFLGLTSYPEKSTELQVGPKFNLGSNLPLVSTVGAIRDLEVLDQGSPAYNLDSPSYGDLGVGSSSPTYDAGSPMYNVHSDED